MELHRVGGTLGNVGSWLLGGWSLTVRALSKGLSLGAIGRALAVTVGATVFAAPTRAQDAVPTAWQLLDDGDPTPWWAHPLAYDANRLRPILLSTGMITSAYNAPVMHWELVGEDWVRRYLPDPTPHAPDGGCMTWDAARGRAVLFGGAGANANQTWEFDGEAWSLRETTTVPAARYQCAMTYDEANERVVMFGGLHQETAQSLPDTWEYDGTDWTNVTPIVSPPRRGWAGFAYDASRERSVLFGGADQSLPKADTWDYDGRRKRWSQKSSTPNPPARLSPGMAYDHVSERTVLYGGRGIAGDLGDTWEWNGQSWTQRSPPSSPSARYGFRMVWDIGRQRVLGWGGSLVNGDFNDTWVWDGVTWSRIALPRSPDVRRNHAMTFDPAVGSVVLYGGVTSLPYSGAPIWDTWHWTWPEGWVRREDVGTPSASGGFGLVHDTAAGRLVGFSGGGSTPKPTDLHEYSGASPTWHSIPSCCPDPREYHGWAHASELGGTILYGGLACCFVGSNYTAEDTWRLIGNSWEQVFPPASPGPRDSMAMDYDGARERVVLFGGTDGFDTYSDTWLFDGETWSRVCDSCPPGARRHVDFAYDDARQVSILYGFGPVGEGSTWEFDGSTWLARPTVWQPEPSRCFTQLSYDWSREVALLFGGGDCLGGGSYRNDTWAYGADPDGDGKVGGLDNCRVISNPSQENLDGDVAGDLCDCAVSDPTAWASPLPVTGLTLSGATTTTIVWDDQSVEVGAGVVYDVATGDLDELRTGDWSGATCLESQSAVPSASDSRIPSEETGFWYLVRGQNVCGFGSFGAAVLDAASPCP